MNKNKFPLRKIVDHRVEWYKDSIGINHRSDFEILECGHEQRPRTDIYGETNAYRRRCRACYREELRENRNGVSAEFRNHCEGWYQYRDDHNWRGRQRVYIVLKERYGHDAIMRRVDWIAAAISAVESEYAVEGR